MEVLAIGKKLDMMRDLTRLLEIAAKELETIHGMLAGGASDVEQHVTHLEQQTKKRWRLSRRRETKTRCKALH